MLPGTACQRAPIIVPAETPALAPPEASSLLVVTPLDKAAADYTNEMQADNLRRETAELGIRTVNQRAAEDEANHEESKVPIAGKLEQLREMRLELTRLRHGIESAYDKSVALPGPTVTLISRRESGGVIGPFEDVPGVWSGSYGGSIEAGEFVVSDVEAWAKLWGRLSQETPPAVDFAKTRVAMVFLGPRPTSGYHARLIGIITEKERYRVRWQEEGPETSEAVIDAATAPFLFASVPKDDRAISWEKIRRTGKQKRKEVSTRTR